MKKSAGRRPGTSHSREDILRAARERFAAHGYEAATMRAIAADAGVDAALVSYFFGSKEGLFAAAMALPVTPADVLSEVLEGGIDGLGERFVASVLAVFDQEANRAPLLGLLRSAAAQPRSAIAVREFVRAEMMGRLVPLMEGEQRELRATLVGSQMVGLLIQRYLIELEPLASAPAADVVAWVGPTLQRYVQGGEFSALESPVWFTGDHPLSR
jgi:AcrR family transcriptional regulator